MIKDQKESQTRGWMYSKPIAGVHHWKILGHWTVVTFHMMLSWEKSQLGTTQKNAETVTKAPPVYPSSSWVGTET